MSSFTAKKLDVLTGFSNNKVMTKNKKRKSSSINVAKNVREQIEAAGERVWRLADFEGMPFTAVAQALSRLTRQGVIQR